MHLVLVLSHACRLSCASVAERDLSRKCCMYTHAVSEPLQVHKTASFLIPVIAPQQLVL